jgi:hypothetical protein
MLNKILSYVIDNVLSLDAIFNRIRSETINENKFLFLQNKIEFTEEGLIAHGKFHDYSINFDKNSVHCDEKFVCISVYHNYRNPSLTEKEQIILTKTLACLNDDIFFPTDSVLSEFVPQEAQHAS